MTYESYPHLSAAEICTLITAIERHVADRVRQRLILDTTESVNDFGATAAVSPSGVAPLLEVLKRIQLKETDTP